MIMSIIIPCFNNWNFTKACLDDLSYLTNDHELIVVDNASTDDTRKNLEKSSAVNKYIRLDKNMGFGYAVNAGFSEASGKNLMTLNNDIRVKFNKDSWTKSIIEECDNLVSPNLGILNKDFSFSKEIDYFVNSKYSYLSGWCLSSSRDNWDKLKLSDNGTHQEYFDERFFVYFEDTDLGFRARQLGINFKVLQIPVVHFGKQSSKNLNTYKLYTDSKKIFEEKWSNYEKSI